MKNLVTIFTNGKSLFTLENYQPSAGVCYAHNITVHSRVSILKKRAMHTGGQLHYVSGCGDRVVLNGVSLRRGQELGNFKVN
jgi:hypothetical protein